MGTGTGVGTETKAAAEMEGDEDGNGDWNEDGIGEGGGEAKRRIKRTRLVDAMWETGETCVERGKNVEKKGLVQKLPTQIIYRITRKQGGGTRNRGLK